MAMPGAQWIDVNRLFRHADERQQRQMPRPLDFAGKLALAARAVVGLATRSYLPVFGDVTAQGIDIFVVKASAIRAVDLHPKATTRASSAVITIAATSVITVAAIATVSALAAITFFQFILLRQIQIAHRFISWFTMFGQNA
jgi:hypothetical protein